MVGGDKYCGVVIKEIFMCCDDCELWRVDSVGKRAGCEEREKIFENELFQNSARVTLVGFTWQKLNCGGDRKSRGRSHIHREPSCNQFRAKEPHSEKKNHKKNKNKIALKRKCVDIIEVWHMH